MKALSVKQPFATWIVGGIKDVENRSWPTKYRGWLLIHAGKIIHNLADTVKPSLINNENYPRGAYVGCAHIADCIQNSKSDWAEPGQWHWVIDKVVRFQSSIPGNGSLGLFEAPQAVSDSAALTILEKMNKKER